MERDILYIVKPSESLSLEQIEIIKELVAVQNTLDCNMHIMFADQDVLENDPNLSKTFEKNIVDFVNCIYELGLDFNKTRFFLQSKVSSLFEMSTYFLKFAEKGLIKNMSSIKIASAISLLNIDVVICEKYNLDEFKGAKALIENFNDFYGVKAIKVPEIVSMGSKDLSFNITDIGNKVSNFLENCAVLNNYDVLKYLVFDNIISKYVSLSNLNKIKNSIGIKENGCYFDFKKRC